MIGVVLWSDPRECKAVIRCEDHGDLAFFHCDDPASCQKPALDAGDLVEFDVNVHYTFRVARNPQLLQEGMFSDLPDVLSKNQAPGRLPDAFDQSRAHSASVVALHRQDVQAVDAVSPVTRKTG